MRLDGRTVVITGVSQGIGRATALRCAEEGADVFGADINGERGEEIAATIRESGSEARFEPLDVSDYDEFKCFLEAVNESADGIDVLVNNAGISRSDPIEETSVAVRDRLISVNLEGPWNGCQIGSTLMKASGGGAIVNVSSVTGLLGLPNFATYSLTKAGVLNLTYSLAAELGPHGIRVNAVCPGRIETPMLDEVLADADNPDRLREQASAEHALNRMGRPEEIANCVIFLASEEASFVTGAALVADGGARFRSPII